MNVNAILAGLQQFSPDRIMTAAGFLLVLLVALAMWLAARRRQARRNIGLSKIAAGLPEGDGPVTRAAPKLSRPDPLEADRLALEMLESDENDAEDIEEIRHTSYTERVNVPNAAARREAAPEPRREPDVAVLAPEPKPEPDPAPRPEPAFRREPEPAPAAPEPRREPDVAVLAPEPKPEPDPAPRPEPAFRREPEPAPVPAVPVVPPMPEWEFLKTLPFIVRQGLSTGHADMLGIGVEAVFFPAEAVNRLDDPVLRLVPFLPADEGELLCRESDRRTFQAGGLYAQPDAVIALRAGGVLAVEYKSRGGRMDDPHDIPGSLRPKDLLQTVIGAMVLSASEGVACAPVLRTNNAVYFLRPGKTLATLLAERIGAAVSFVKPYAERSGISASDYAELCVVPAQMLSGRPVRSEGDLRGEAAHARMLR